MPARSLLIFASACLAASASSQVPTVITAKPPQMQQVPVPPGTMTELGNGIFLDGQGDLTVENLVRRDGLVDVRNFQFAVGCPNSADQNGVLDSTCAVQNAIAWIAAHPIAGAGFARLYFPHGHYLVGSLPGLNPNGTLFHMPKMIGWEGDGPQLSVIENRSASSITMQYDGTEDCNSLSIDECQFSIQHLLFTGAGGATTSGGLEAINTGMGMVHDVQFQNFGGVALNLEGGSERWVFDDMALAANNRTVLEQGDTNENNWTRVNVDTPGIDRKGYCYSSPVCVNHQLPVIGTGATWYPSPRAAVFLDGVKNQWRDSSMKALVADSGIHMTNEAGVVEQNYFEGYPWGGQPRMNFAVEAGGKQELSHTTAPMTTTSLQVPIDDAIWTPIYLQSASDLKKIGSHAGRDQYCAYPSDYLTNSTVMSTAVPSITRGTKECFQVLGAAGDGNLYLLTRGASPVAWPAGTVIEQTPPNFYGAARVVGNHLNSTTPLSAYNAATYLDGCSDTAQRTNWTGNPSRMCATAFAGYVPDGYGVPFPSSHYYFPTNGTLLLESNSNFVGGTEVDGQGFVKVGANSDVTIQGEGPLQGFQDIAQVTQAYINGGARIAYVNYGGAVAMGTITDLGARAVVIPSWGYFDALIPLWNQGLAHQHTGSKCDYNMVAGSNQPTERTCEQANGKSVTQDFISGNWVTQPGTKRVYTAQATEWKAPTSFAAAPMGSHTESGQSSNCPVRQGAWTSNMAGFSPGFGNPTWLTFNPPLPSGFTWNLSFNGFGQWYGPAGSQVASANIWVQVCNTNPTAQTLPASQTVMVNQVQ